MLISEVRGGSSVISKYYKQSTSLQYSAKVNYLVLRNYFTSEEIKTECLSYI